MLFCSKTRCLCYKTCVNAIYFRHHLIFVIYTKKISVKIIAGLQLCFYEDIEINPKSLKECCFVQKPGADVIKNAIEFQPKLIYVIYARSISVKIMVGLQFYFCESIEINPKSLQESCFVQKPGGNIIKFAANALTKKARLYI